MGTRPVETRVERKEEAATTEQLKAPLKKEGGKEGNKEGKRREKEKRKRKKKKKIREEEGGEEELVIFLKPQPQHELVEEYWIREPFVKARIMRAPELGGQYIYYIEEVELTPEERRAANKLIEILSYELEPPERFDIDVRKHVIDEARRLAEKYKGAVGRIPEDSWDRVIYYVERNLLGFGPLNPLMEDWNLEDISCDGAGVSVYVWHRKYESIPTNLVFIDRDYLRDFIVKLAHMAGKHVSSAFPIVDAMLPGGHRLAATYGEEVSPKGSSFTIRKFRERPFSVIDLLESGNIDEWTAAYIWLMIENKRTLMVLGATAAGKTTFLNAVAGFFKPGMKIVTIEETPELRLPHENWVQLVSRESYGLGGAQAGTIDLYELVRVSLRYRPDYIIVGEVRGREAFVLFQAMATGHGGLSTMHAEDLESAIRRLTTPPMNVSESYIPSLNVVVYVERTLLPDGSYGRRLRYLWEILDKDRHILLVEWDPKNDVHRIVGESHHLKELAEYKGVSVERLLDEIERRKVYLRWLRRKGIRNIEDVSRHINEYYNFPEESFRKALEELKTLGEKVPSAPLPKATPARLPRIKETEAKPRKAPAVSIKAATEKGDRKETGIPVRIGDAERKILKTLSDLGGESGYTELIKTTGLKSEEFWRALNNLRAKKLVIPVITYVAGKPKMGYKLTSDAKKLSSLL